MIQFGFRQTVNSKYVPVYKTDNQTEFTDYTLGRLKGTPVLYKFFRDLVRVEREIAYFPNDEELAFVDKNHNVTDNDSIYVRSLISIHAFIGVLKYVHNEGNKIITVE